jgi:RHS repeat-associated protein
VSSDPLGRTTSFSYDLLDRVTKTISPDGRFVEIEYDEAGNVAVRRDHLGRETRYGYDLADRLSTVTRPDGTMLHHAYDAAGRKTTATDPLGQVTRFEYDGLGRLTKTIFPDNTFETMAYDAEGRLLSRTDELGRVTSFEHDPLGRLLATTDPMGARWESRYDAAGRKLADTDPLGRVTGYQVDLLDRVTNVTRPDGSSVSHTFDAVGNLLRTVDALGHQWRWVYDGLNRPVQAVRPDGASSTTAFDAAGHVVGEIDVMGRQTLYAYDSGGRRTSVTDALGQVWQFRYDDSGRLVAVVDPLGNTTQTAYDVMDRVVSETDALGRTVRFEHDAAGRLIARTDALGRRALTAYDLRNRVTAQVDPEGRTVHFGYDAAGQRVSLVDGANRVWRWLFDGAGRVISETDPLGNVVRSGYDLAGNRLTRTNARGELTAFSFDLGNRLTKVTFPDGAVATLGYDLEGREVVRSWAGGVVRKSWDAVGNLTSEMTDPWGKGWEYRWDPSGNRVGAVAPTGGRFVYRFDALNRLVELDAPGDNDDMRISYDAAGRVVLEDRAAVESEYAYDATGRLLELRHFRDKGRKRTLVASRRYSYDLAGNRVAVLDEDGDESRFAYDGSDWLIRAAYPGGKVVSYAYNGAGDRLREIIETSEWQGHGRHRTPATQTVTLVYQYDPAGRMVARASDTFRFDADGNTVSATEGGNETRYQWSSDNRLLRAERTLPCGHKHGTCHCTPKVTYEEYSYAPEDWKRLTRTVGLDGGHGEKERTFVSIFDEADESHEYELKLSPGHGYKHGKCHPPKDRIGLELKREFIGGPGTDDLVASKYRGHGVGLLKDALGSTIALTNHGGNPIARVNYDAWGVIEAKEKDPDHHKKPCGDDDEDDYLDRFFGGRGLGQINPWRFGAHFGLKVNPYLFASRRFEPFTLTYNHRNRYYNPRHGRFNSADPLGFQADINLYRYANANPLRFTDPFGLEIREAIYQLGRRGYAKLATFLELNSKPANWPEILDIFNRRILPDPKITDLYREIFHWPKQEQHLGGPGTPGYIEPKSYLTIDPIPLPTHLSGEKYYDFGDVIGKYINQCGEEFDSTQGVIEYSIDKAGRALGIHIYPGRQKNP